MGCGPRYGASAGGRSTGRCSAPARPCATATSTSWPSSCATCSATPPTEPRVEATVEALLQLELTGALQAHHPASGDHDTRDLTGLLANPMVLVAVVSSLVSASALVLRTALVEVRWWLALRDTPPAARPEIRALHRPVLVRAVAGAGRGGRRRRDE